MIECPICNERYDTEFQLQCHMERWHCKTGQWEWTCFCNAKFHYPADCARHITENGGIIAHYHQSVLGVKP